MAKRNNIFSEIIFQKLISTVDGIGASTGKQTEVAFNENFDLVKRYLEALISVAQITVTSEQLTQIRVDTTTTPYTVYYTTDPIGTEPTWIKLINMGFGDLSGDPADNIALKTILDSKGSAGDVATLQTQMTTAQENISDLQTLTSQHTTDIGANASSIHDIQDELLDVVHTQHGDTLYIRYVPTTNTIEYSIDAVNWTDITSAGTSWGALSGSPTDSATLVSYVTNEIDLAIDGLAADFVTEQEFTDHLIDYNNPHKVTKAQLGLGNVQNYSPADMPLSNLAQTKFQDLETRYPDFAFITSSEYQNGTLGDRIYLVSDQYIT